MIINNTADLREGLDKLLMKRELLQREINEIEDVLAGLRRYVSKESRVITEIHPAATPAKPPIHRVGRGPTSGLRGAIANVLATGPATSRQIRDQLKSEGHSGNAKNLQAIVNNTMKRNPQQFSKNELGAWELVPEAMADLI